VRSNANVSHDSTVKGVSFDAAARGLERSGNVPQEAHEIPRPPENVSQP
jgi:hypothetical protein